MMANIAVLPERPVSSTLAPKVSQLDRAPLVYSNAYKKKNKKTWLLVSMVVAILIDLTLAYLRNYKLRLDGDIAPIVWPRADYAHILHDPFGWAALTHNAMYAGINRFFAHMAMILYFHNVPLLLQKVVDPITSLYASTALFNVTVQALLLYVLGWYATGTRRLNDWRLWLAMVLMAPFFQTTGYNRQMAIIDNAVTYNFFYAFPLLILLVLMWPLYRAITWRQPMRLSAPKFIAMLLLSVVLAFNGPIITGTIMVMLLGVGVYTVRQRYQLSPAHWLRGLPWQVVLLLGWMGALCLYSLYIGRNNTENLITSTVPLGERFLRVPGGIFVEVTDRLGIPLLLLSCLANAQFMRRLVPTTENLHLARVLNWVWFFALVYMALLPLGGYRPYRPHIIHHDCIVPITVALVGFYGLSTGRLLMQLSGRAQRWYTVGVVAMAVIYLNADRRMTPQSNGLRERQALEVLAHAGPGPVVRLPEECSVLTWDPVRVPLSSLTSAELLHYWNVTKERKLYYYQPSQ